MSTGSHSTTTPFRASLLPAIFVFIITAVVFSQYGFEGPLTRDNSLVMYSGQQMAGGVPPYVSIFDHKGPLAPMMIGAGVMIASFFNLNDILTVRILFFMFASLSAVGLYFLGYTLFASRKAGFLASFIFIGFWGFGKHAASGPQPKTPMVLFEILALLLTANRKWFWAGFCGSLAFLIWQPMAVYPVMTFALAIIQSEKGKERTRNIIRAVSGTLTPIAMVCIYFLYKGALHDLIDGAVLFNIIHLERDMLPPYKDIMKSLRFIYNGYTLMTGPVFLGLLMMCVMYVWRARTYGNNIRELLSKDPFSMILLSFPFPVIWSLMDFQGYTDFYVFLPYVALGFGWLLYLLLKSKPVTAGSGHDLSKILFIIICAVLIGAAAINYRATSDRGLQHQRQWANQVRSMLGEESRFVSIGRPSILALLHMTNPNRYVFITFGIDNYIEANTPGGFYGWLKQLEKYDPSVIALGKTRGRYRNQLISWLHMNYQEKTVGEWTLFVKSKKENIE